jgi:hypothetical protein
MASATTRDFSRHMQGRQVRQAAQPAGALDVRPEISLPSLHVPAHWLRDPAFYQRCLSDAAARFSLGPVNHNLAQRLGSRALPMDYSVVADLEYLQALAEIDGRVGPGLEYSNLDSVLVLDGVDLAAPKGGTGVSRSAIRKLIKKGGLVAEKSDQELGTCSVCLEELSSPDGAELLRMDCSHLYHQRCILPWLEKRNSCPTCRREVGR